MKDHLKRIGEADRNLRRDGRDPEPFLLIYAGGMTREILHPTWNDSWAAPSAEDVDDLEELMFVRTQPAQNAKRIFSLTVKGREQASVLAEPVPTTIGGRSPSLDVIISWLEGIESEEPEILDLPGRLIPKAIADKFIHAGSREALATRIIDLLDQGYLAGDIPRLDQASAEQLLGLSNGLRLTMKAHGQTKKASDSASVHFHGSVIAGQIAAGDINNFVSLDKLLDQAAVAVQSLAAVPEREREEALSLIDVLRGKALAAGADLMTGAGGGMLASVIAQLLGIPRVS